MAVRGAMSSRHPASIAGGLDLHGFGRFTDAYPEMAEPANEHAPLGRAED
jgi:hypothetical protein